MSHAKQLHNRRYLDDYLQIVNRTGLLSNVQVDVCQQVQDMVIATVQSAIEQALEEELTTLIGCECYAHLPWGRRPDQTRSRTYCRTLLTQYGCIPALHVPKLRRGNGHLTWQTITRYERCWGPLLDQQIMGYCLGLSLRLTSTSSPSGLPIRSWRIGTSGPRSKSRLFSAPRQL
jgi:Transposase, Mutator family